MRVLFCPYHAYLSQVPFAAVIQELQRRQVACIWGQLYGTPFDHANREALDTVPSGVQCEELHLSRIFRGRVPNAFAAVRNWKEISRFIRRIQPSALVISSDTGGVSIRMLQEICHRERIPVFVLVTAAYSPVPKTGSLLPSWPGFLRSLFVQPANVGHYSQAKLLVDSQATQQTIVASGIVPSRCVVTGNPAYDLIKRHSGTLQTTLALSLGLAPQTRIILFVTEALESLFSSEYTSQVLRVISQAARELPPDFVLVCKPHPRETAHEMRRIRDEFKGEKFMVTDLPDNDLLVAGASLVIGHYSSMLLQALLSGTAVLSLRMKGKDAAQAVFGSEKGFAVESWNELRSVLQHISQDPRQALHQLQEAGQKALYALGMPTDQSSTMRVADILTATGRRN